MSSSPNKIDCPLRRARRNRTLVAVVGGVAACAAGIWAFLPLHQPDLHLEPASLKPEQAASRSAVDAFPINAFNAPVWVEPPPPPVVQVEEKPKIAPPPPPVRLALVAILNQPDGLVAALYDEEKDELRFVPAGASIGRTEIAVIDPAGVTLRTNGREQRLALNAEGSQ